MAKKLGKRSEPSGGKKIGERGAFFFATFLFVFKPQLRAWSQAPLFRIAPNDLSAYITFRNISSATRTLNNHYFSSLVLSRPGTHEANKLTCSQLYAGLHSSSIAFDQAPQLGLWSEKERGETNWHLDFSGVYKRQLLEICIYVHYLYRIY